MRNRRKAESLIEAVSIQHNFSTKDRRSKMCETQRHPKQGVTHNTCALNGEGGIRTRGTVLPVRRFSKAVLSTTQPPLRVGGDRRDARAMRSVHQPTS